MTRYETFDSVIMKQRYMHLKVGFTKERPHHGSRRFFGRGRRHLGQLELSAMWATKSMAPITR